MKVTCLGAMRVIASKLECLASGFWKDGRVNESLSPYLFGKVGIGISQGHPEWPSVKVCQSLKELDLDISSKVGSFHLKLKTGLDSRLKAYTPGHGPK